MKKLTLFLSVVCVLLGTILKGRLQPGDPPQGVFHLFTLRPAGLEESRARKAVEESLLAGLEEKDKTRQGLRLALNVHQEVVIWGLSPGRPLKEVAKLALLERPKAGKALFGFSAPATVLIYREELWEKVSQEVEQLGGFHSQAGKQDLQRRVERILSKPKKGKWAALTLKPEKGRKPAGAPKPVGPPGLPEELKGVVYYDTVTSREIARIYYRARLRSKRVEIRVVSPPDIGLDTEDIYQEIYRYEQDFLEVQRRLAGEINKGEHFRGELDEEGRLFKLRSLEGSELESPEEAASVYLLAYDRGEGSLFTLDLGQGLLIKRDRKGELVSILEPGGGLTASQRRQLYTALGAIARSGGVVPPIRFTQGVAYSTEAAEVFSRSASLKLKDGKEMIFHVTPGSWSVETAPPAKTGEEGFASQTAGMEEGSLRDQLDSLFRGIAKAAQGKDWKNLERLLDQADALPKSLNIHQDREVRVILDFIVVQRIYFLLNRHIPDDWSLGDPISDKAFDDLEDLLALGSFLLRQVPPPAAQVKRLVKTMQANALMHLSASGRYSDRTQVEKTLTDPLIPLGHAFSLLHARWLAKAVQEERKVGRLEIPHPTNTKALAYALLHVMTPSYRHLSKKEYQTAPDSLLVFLPQGTNLPEDLLKRRRQAVRRVLNRFLRSPKTRRPEIPKDMVEEALIGSIKGYEPTFLDLAEKASLVLAAIAPDPATQWKFSQLAIQLREGLESHENFWLLYSLGDRLLFQQPPAYRVLAGPIETAQRLIDWLKGNLSRLEKDLKVDLEWIRVQFYTFGKYVRIAKRPEADWVREIEDLLKTQPGPYRVLSRWTWKREKGRWVRLRQLIITTQSPFGPEDALLKLADLPPGFTSGLEELTLEQFQERYGSLPGLPERISIGTTRVWVGSLASMVHIYGEGPAMALGLKGLFRRKVPEVPVAVWEVPLSSGQRFWLPGVLVEDKGLPLAVAHPPHLPRLEIWLVDLGDLDPAYLLWLALRLGDSLIKPIGMAVFESKAGLQVAIFV